MKARLSNPGTSKANMIIGYIQKGTSTKQLVRRLEPMRIIVIRHSDLDEVAAESIVEANVTAIINAAPIMTGDYPTKGPLVCLEAGIPIFEIDPGDYDQFRDHAYVEIHDSKICLYDPMKTKFSYIPCKPFTRLDWSRMASIAERNLPQTLDRFIENTLEYAKKEKDFFLQKTLIPPVRTMIRGKQVVIVVRGSRYKQDLQAIRPFIDEERPVLIGVDGGADALLEQRLSPDIIIGDMDSISDEALRSGGEIFVHAYPNGYAPGWERIEKLSITAEKICAPGTSEDIAILFAYEQQAELIITIGTHTHMIDFLEKGRRGMASTMLVRMKTGSKLIDAKGVSLLYKPRPKKNMVWALPVFGLLPLFVIVSLHPVVRHYVELLLVYMKLLVS